MQKKKASVYDIRYHTRKGGSGIMTTTDFIEVEKKVISLFKQRLEATVYKDGVEIGRVWKQDRSQVKRWNYTIERESKIQTF
jgi:hypothetical protein